MLPWLSRLYGLTWADIETMPRAERHEYLKHLELTLSADDPGEG